jgi:hypothetical protein
MDFYKFFINILVSIVAWLSYFSLILVILQKVVARSSDLYQYKLTNKYLSIFFVCVYITVFLIFLYGLRIYNIHRTVDLKEVYQSCLLILDIIKLTPIFLRFNLVLMCIWIFLIVLLLLLGLHKFFTYHIYILYLYYRHKIISERFQSFLSKLRWIGHDDLISYYLYDIIYRTERLFYGSNYDYKSMCNHNNFYIFKYIINHRYYRTMITFSPFIIIAYDCIFNNWILVHVYYYLLLYVPLMVIKRITSALLSESTIISKILCNIYYKKELCFYALSKEHKRILDLYLLTELRKNVELDFNIEVYLEDIIQYELYNEERNTYRNNEGIYLQKKDNRVYLEIKIDVEDEKDNLTDLFIVGEEYILLADKTKTNNIKHELL